MKNPRLFPAGFIGSTTWDEWLAAVDAMLQKRGYRKYHQDYRSADYTYWKTYSAGEDKLYMVGIGFYDQRKYTHIDHNADYVGVQFECMILGDDRIDMSVSKDVALKEFEGMAMKFYGAMKEYVKKS